MEVYTLEVSEYILEENYDNYWVTDVFTNFEECKKVIKEILLPLYEKNYSEEWTDIRTREYKYEDNISYDIVAFGSNKEDPAWRQEIFSFTIKERTLKEKAEDYNS